MQSLQADQSLYNRKGVCQNFNIIIQLQVSSPYGEIGDGKFTTFFRIYL